MLKKIPDIKTAKELLKEAVKTGPGGKEFFINNKPGWLKHSYVTAKAARIIAENSKKLNPDYAYSLGLLHDIGRMEQGDSWKMLRHTIDGYNFLNKKNYEDAAKICITHIAPNKNIYSYAQSDCTNDEYKFLINFVKNTLFDDYDKLIQLCDMLALPIGCCILEQRFVAIGLNYGVNDYMIDNWKVSLNLKTHFDNMCGKSIYSILPNIVENTINYVHKF
jgi:putative nucleotidyltransferase with HDIG domain